MIILKVLKSEIIVKKKKKQKTCKKPQKSMNNRREEIKRIHRLYFTCLIHFHNYLKGQEKNFSPLRLDIAI